MTEEKTTLETARAAEPTASAATPVDGSNADSRPELSLGGSSPDPLQPDVFSRISFSPELRQAISYAKLSRRRIADLQGTPQPEQALRALGTPTARNTANAPVERGSSTAANLGPNTAPETEPVPAVAAPRARAGVILACLLGTVPIIALALVRGQGSGAEIPAGATTVSQTGTAQTEVSDFAARSALASALATRDSEVTDAPLEPGIAAASLVPVPQTNGRSSSMSSAPAAPVVASRPSAASRRAPGPNTPRPVAPVQAPWFEYR